MAYSQPSSLTDALELLAQSDPCIIAGGTDIYPAMTGRDLQDHVVDISRLSELRGIHASEKGLLIGALTTWSDITKAALPAAFEGLRKAASQIGGVQIQNAGTVAGNLCNASPAADSVPPLLTLDARVILASATGERQITLEEFLLGPRQTDRACNEILTSVFIPHPAEDARSSFEKLGARSYLVISVAMVACLLRCDIGGRIAEARIAVGAASPVAKRLRRLEEDLIGQDPALPMIRESHLEPLDPVDDTRGSAVYRLTAIKELCKRSIREAARVV